MKKTNWIVAASLVWSLAGAGAFAQEPLTRQERLKALFEETLSPEQVAASAACQQGTIQKGFDISDGWLLYCYRGEFKGGDQAALVHNIGLDELNSHGFTNSKRYYLNRDEALVDDSSRQIVADAELVQALAQVRAEAPDVLGSMRREKAMREAASAERAAKAAAQAAEQALQAAERKWEEESDAPIGDAELSGNVVAGSRQTGSALPGLGAHFLYEAGDQHQHRSPDKQAGAFGRIGGEYTVGAWDAAEGNAGLAGAQVRIGLGVIEKNDLYYMPVVNADYDAVSRSGASQKAAVVMVGGEFGKLLRGGNKNAVYAGVYTGMARSMASNDGDSRFATGLAAGVSLDARVGPPETPGTVRLGLSGGMIPNGWRGNASVDIHVTEHVEVGGEIRQAYLAAPEGPGQAVNMVTPVLRISLSGN